MLITTGRNRIYAVAGKNRILASCLGLITISQFVLGLCITAYAATNGCESDLRIPLTILTDFNISFQRYRSCRSHFRFVRCAFSWGRGSRESRFLQYLLYTVRRFPRPSGFAFETPTLIVPPSDLLAFSAIVYLVVRSNIYYEVPIPSLLKTIARDATYYFLVIFTSHLVLVMFLLFASVRDIFM